MSEPAGLLQRVSLFLSAAGRCDPRLYQIAVLGSLLTYGLLSLGFDISPVAAALTLSTALATQAICDRLSGRPVNVQSALISGLSLCLLLRTNDLRLTAVAASIAIASKFAFRVDAKHVFNPTNFAVIALLLATDSVWVSPGQWGDAAFFAFLMGCLGSVVVTRAARADVTFAFLFFYVGLLMLRSTWLGEPLAIPLHRLQNGALLLFAFFMISDPKTTPDSRAGRVLFAGLVALGAAYVQFRLFRTNGLLWSLALWSLIVPVIDRLVPGTRYVWNKPLNSNEGAHNETPRLLDAADRVGHRPVPAATRLLRVLRHQG